MKLGIIIHSNESEIVWNAFRLGIFSLKKSDSVNVFLLAKGVECESLDTPKFNIKSNMQSFVDLGGKILACGTCLKIGHSDGSQMCPLSSMSDLYDIINSSDKVLTF